MRKLDSQKRECVLRLLRELINQDQARVLVPPYGTESGFWFGGGNAIADEHGVIWLCGRYRNAGDARTGVGKGERGLECAVFRSDDDGNNFEKVLSWSKADLSGEGDQVVSIEGTALHRLADGRVELFISSEKDRPYPDPFTGYQKPGTGVWTIDRMIADSVEGLEPASLEPVLENIDRPEYLHVKDPVVFDDADRGTILLFCSHPFTWSSANTGMAVRVPDGKHFDLQSWELVSRGPAWDVASTRLTARLRIPQVGLFGQDEPCSVYFYDGCECVRELEENEKAERRPRGYSCEEIGGALFGWNNEFPDMERLSAVEPLFISPHGTGCSRYVDVVQTTEGLLATWQQSQPDGSQPLVGHIVPMDEVHQILNGSQSS
ncbi:MAG: exo-alpha-sialidase [Planctomycetes bacterium]|nr:exo-alpha-sialidase [Planctomycetota bacterium]